MDQRFVVHDSWELIVYWKTSFVRRLSKEMQMLKLIVRGVFKQRQTTKFVRRILKEKQMLKFCRKSFKGEANAQNKRNQNNWNCARKGTSNSAGIKQEPLSQFIQFVTKYLLYLWQVPYLSLQTSSTRYCVVLCNEYTHQITIGHGWQQPP